MVSAMTLGPSSTYHIGDSSPACLVLPLPRLEVAGREPDGCPDAVRRAVLAGPSGTGRLVLSPVPWGSRVPPAEGLGSPRVLVMETLAASWLPCRTGQAA